jgi:hypothetical protein
MDRARAKSPCFSKTGGFLTRLRPVERGVVGVVVLRIYFVLRDTQSISDFTVSNKK